MKLNLYILAMAFIASVTARASSFYLHFDRPSNYTVSIDGYNYQVNGLSFKSPDLQPGRHNLSITSFAMPVNQRRRPMQVMLYNGPLMVREFSNIFASLGYQGFHIDRVIAERQYDNRCRHSNDYRYNDQGESGNDEDDYYNNNYNYNDNNNNCRDNKNTNGRDYYGNNNTEDYSGNNYLYMNTRDFDAFKQSIMNCSFESTKRNIAMSGISQNQLSVYQIREIIQLFTFESTKLEIAKYAFNYTNDKNKYYILNDAFSFDSSKDELARLAGSR